MNKKTIKNKKKLKQNKKTTKKKYGGNSKNHVRTIQGLTNQGRRNGRNNNPSGTTEINKNPSGTTEINKNPSSTIKMNTFKHNTDSNTGKGTTLGVTRVENQNSDFYVTRDRGSYKLTLEKPENGIDYVNSQKYLVKNSASNKISDPLLLMFKEGSNRNNVNKERGFQIKLHDEKLAPGANNKSIEIEKKNTGKHYYGYFTDKKIKFQDTTIKDEEKLIEKCKEAIESLYDVGYINKDLKEVNLVIDLKPQDDFNVLFIDTDPNYFIKIEDIDIKSLNIDEEQVKKCIVFLSLCQLLFNVYNSKLISDDIIYNFLKKIYLDENPIDILVLKEILYKIDDYIAKKKEENTIFEHHESLFSVMIYQYLIDNIYSQIRENSLLYDNVELRKLFASCMVDKIFNIINMKKNISKVIKVIPEIIKIKNNSLTYIIEDNGKEFINALKFLQ